MSRLDIMKASQMFKSVKKKSKSTRTITLKTEKGKIVTLQRNKIRDGNILKCINESTQSATNNGGPNIADRWEF